MTDYFIPEEHIQLREIANTPLWLREHFKKEGKSKTLDKCIEIIRTHFTKINALNKDLELHEFNDVIYDIEQEVEQMRSEVKKYDKNTI